jgi:MFS family permease
MRVLTRSYHSYQFGQAVGGVILPPYSECYGRKRCYIYSTALYSLSCALIGFLPRSPAIAIGRFVSGFASAVPSVVIAGSVEDIFNSRWRVWMVLFWNWSTTAGLISGPIFGSFVAKSLDW